MSGERLMPGPAQKHPGKRVRKTRTRSIGVVHSAGVAPLMPWNLCKPAQAAWRSYFADAVSGVLREADTPIVVRWEIRAPRLLSWPATVPKPLSAPPLTDAPSDGPAVIAWIEQNCRHSFQSSYRDRN
jgi:hypothetical protein